MLGFKVWVSVFLFKVYNIDIFINLIIIRNLGFTQLDIKAIAVQLDIKAIAVQLVVLLVSKDCYA